MRTRHCVLSWHVAQSDVSPHISSPIHAARLPRDILGWQPSRGLCHGLDRACLLCAYSLGMLNRVMGLLGASSARGAGLCAYEYTVVGLMGVAEWRPSAGGRAAVCEPRVGVLSGAAPGPTVSGLFQVRLLPCSLAGCFWAQPLTAQTWANLHSDIPAPLTRHPDHPLASLAAHVEGSLREAAQSSQPVWFGTDGSGGPQASDPRLRMATWSLVAIQQKDGHLPACSWKGPEPDPNYKIVGFAVGALQVGFTVNDAESKALDFLLGLSNQNNAVVPHLPRPCQRPSPSEHTLSAGASIEPQPSHSPGLPHAPSPESKSGPPNKHLVWRRPPDPPSIARPSPQEDKPATAPAMPFLLDLFSGQNTPISVAAKKLGIPRWEPVDITLDNSQDILSDSFFQRLLDLAWSGQVALLVAAPPCREYSILKLAPGGPPACRSPEHLSGLPSNSPKLMRRAKDSRTIHERCHQLCRAVSASGGIWVLENPPSSMAWMEPSCQQLLRSAAAHVTSVPACAYGLPWSKSWAFACNSPHIQQLQQECRHSHKHASLLNKRDKTGNFISSATAEYPARLAQDLLSCFKPLLPTSKCPQALPLPSRPRAPTHMAGPGPRAPACDGAGLQSTADFAHAPSAPTSLLPLASPQASDPRLRMATWSLVAIQQKDGHLPACSWKGPEPDPNYKIVGFAVGALQVGFTVNDAESKALDFLLGLSNQNNAVVPHLPRPCQRPSPSEHTLSAGASIEPQPSHSPGLPHAPSPESKSGPPNKHLVWRRPPDPPSIARPSPQEDKPATAPAMPFLLDLFSGQNTPISVAAKKLGIPRWEPVDITLDNSQDILSDSFFQRLLDLAWSGQVALLVAAPPCREYSILKLAPGGPPACRSPEHLSGLPSNSPKLMRRAKDSRTIHERCHQLCRAVSASGGIWVLENPPSSMAWMEPSCQQLLRSAAAHVTSVPACAYGLPWSKSWAFACNSPHIQQLQQECRHSHKHASLLNKRDKTGNFISSATAEYPARLAQDLLSCFKPLLPTSKCPQALPLPSRPRAPTHMAGPGPRAPACDGAGLQSTADFAHAPSAPTSLLPLASRLQTWCLYQDRHKRIAAHIAQSKPEHPLSAEEQLELLNIASDCLSLPLPETSRIEESHSDYRFWLTSQKECLQASTSPFQAATNGLSSTLNKPKHPLGTCLKEFDTNWKNAEAQPDLLQSLIEEEMAQGWVVEIAGGEKDARARWPKGIAIGKLNVVQAEGKDPRMVLDSSVCNVNPLCTLPERVCLPTSADVRATFKPSDPKHASQGAALDFKAAHKRVKVRP